MSFIDVKLIKQLKDMAQEVNWRKCKNALGQMFTIKTALVKKTPIEWFDKKITLQYLQLDLMIKNQYERKHPINWKTEKRVICKMLLNVDPLGLALKCLMVIFPSDMNISS